MIVADDKQFEDPDYMVMADDGKGESVYIATFLISMYDGMKLKEAIHHKDIPKSVDAELEDLDQDEDEEEPAKKHNKVIVQADIDLISKTDDVIQVDLWYSGAYELLQAGIDFAKYSQMQSIFTENIKF